MAAVTICSDFEAQENKVCHCFYCFPIYLPWSDGTRCHDLSFVKEKLLQMHELGLWRLGIVPAVRAQINHPPSLISASSSLNMLPPLPQHVEMRTSIHTWGLLSFPSSPIVDWAGLGFIYQKCSFIALQFIHCVHLDYLDYFLQHSREHRCYSDSHWGQPQVPWRLSNVFRML